jgi:hypothetical protein
MAAGARSAAVPFPVGPRFRISFAPAASPVRTKAGTFMVGNFCFRPESRPGERRAVGAGHAIPQTVWW